MYTKRRMVITVAILLIGITVSQITLAKKGPPKNKLILENKFENIVDNSWSNLEMLGSKGGSL